MPRLQQVTPWQHQLPSRQPKGTAEPIELHLMDPAGLPLSICVAMAPSLSTYSVMGMSVACMAAVPVC